MMSVENTNKQASKQANKQTNKQTNFVAFSWQRKYTEWSTAAAGKVVPNLRVEDVAWSARE
jgi:hypothetical protein